MDAGRQAGGLAGAGVGAGTGSGAAAAACLFLSKVPGRAPGALE